jgi:TPR repeat protein
MKLTNQKLPNRHADFTAPPDKANLGLNATFARGMEGAQTPFCRNEIPPMGQWNRSPSGWSVPRDIMRMTFNDRALRLRTSAAAAILLAGAIHLGAQAPEESSLIASNLTDSELLDFSKAEVRFATEALPMVQSRICIYAEGAKTSHGQPFISELRIPRATVPPRSLCLTNANSATRMYLDFAMPPALSTGEVGAAWTELGFAVLERANSVLHHYYLAVEYRRGHEAALKHLRERTRNLAAYLAKRGAAPERLGEIKANYAALWFDRCEDVLPAYHAIIGSGARGVVRDALVRRPADLPLFTAWTWEERKKADTVQKQFIQQLSSSTNGIVRIEGLLLGLARTKTDRAYARAFTNVLDAIDLYAMPQGTRTAYVNVIHELLQDRHSKDLTEKTRNELRGMYDVRFVASTTTNAPAATGTNAVAAAGPTVGTAVPAGRPAHAKTETLAATNTAAGSNAVKLAKIPASAAPAPVRSTPKPIAAVPASSKQKGPPSWQLLMTPADIRYWETMPLPEIRSMAATGDVVANYYVFLKLRNSDKPGSVTEADAALAFAVKAGLPQAELAHANRETDAEERFHWTKKAAGTGYPEAQLALGKLHILGHGTSTDTERGLSLVRASYDLKVPEAEAVLAELYASGIGDARSIPERPENLFFAAARNNQSAAMLELHNRYLEGYGVARDQLEACRWLVNVGLHDKTVLTKYLDESGIAVAQASVELDRFAKTLAVYAQAIIYKQPEAIKHVAEWYSTGSIGRKSSLRAYALLSLASNSGKVTPDALQKVRSALTPQQLKTAEILTTQWQRIQPDLL